MYASGKVTIIHFLDGLIRKIYYKDESLYPETYKSFGGNVEVKLDLIMQQKLI